MLEVKSRTALAQFNFTSYFPDPKMSCFLRFDDCKISYFEINFDIKRQVVTNKAKAGPGFALFSSSRVANILALRLCFAK